MRSPVSITLFHDLLSPFCAIASARLTALADELGPAVRIERRPCPLWLEGEGGAQAERERARRRVRAVAREPEGAGFVETLWREAAPYCLPPLVAVEAARLQGAHAADRLIARLQRAAFVEGLDISRRDVIAEIAEREGLDLGPFLVALDTDGARRAVERSRDEALARGVWALPAVVIGEERLLTGMRPLAEYREEALRWLAERADGGTPPRVH